MNAETLIGMVLGTCTLQKLIGQGGMGAVFLAQQSRPNRQVAVKVLLPMAPLAPNQRAAFLERFRRETDVVASLEHPNIMPVHEYGERDGLAYLVMPYISGGTLRDELDREGPLPIEKVVLYLEQMAAALAIAHENGVIHRDIKPANILVRQGGRLLLTDFGLVRIVSEGQSAGARLTGIGVPLGTPDYMAPEQVMSAEVDARADLYALGVILYQMVTGTVPFKADMPMQVAILHMQAPPPPPRSLRPDLPPAAEQVILRALAKRPDDRYQNVQEFANAFRQSLIVSGISLPDFSTLLAPGGMTDIHLSTPRSLLDPLWKGPSTEHGADANENPLTAAVPHAFQQHMQRKDIIGKTSIPMPSLTSFMLPGNTPLPPSINAQPEIPKTAQPASPMHNRPFLGHKFNLRRPTDALEQSPLMPSPPEAEAQPFQNARLPHTSLSAFAAPMEGSGLSAFAAPMEGSGLRPSPMSLPGQDLHSLPSSPAERSGLRPAPGRFLGRSSLRPLGPNTLSGSEAPPFPSMLTEPAEKQPLPSTPQAHMSSQFSPSSHINRVFENAEPFRPADKQVHPEPGIAAFNPPPAFPSATGSLNNSMIQPLDGSPIPTFSGSTAQLPGNSTTQLPGNSTTQQLGTSPARQVTGALVMGNMGMSNAGTGTGNTGMMKLEQAAKVVQVPVAGQPGRYVTGLLPVLEEQKTSLPPPIAKKVAAVDELLKGRLKLIMLITVAALIVFGSITFFVVQSHTGSHANQNNTAGGSDAAATANSLATSNSNVIIKDPLDGKGGNIHNLPLGASKDGSSFYAFKNNAYHITVTGSKNAATAVVPGVSMDNPSTYTLTMEAIKGDESGNNGTNSFGVFFCLGQHKKGNTSFITFYTFEVVNTRGGEYQFSKYDSAANVSGSLIPIWHNKFGKEFHLGHGPHAMNTLNISLHNSTFTFTMNGTVVKKLQDKSFQGGGVGMIVNLQGTEVAFSNLLLTKN